MKFHCPYCNFDFGEAPTVQCPKCGRYMHVPTPFLHISRRESKRAIEKIWRDAEKQRRTMFGIGIPSGRSPAVIVLALILLSAAGSLLLTRVDRLIPQPAKVRDPSSVAQRELNTLRIALENFKADCGRYPETGEGLYVLITNPGTKGWSGPYVNVVRSDPWTNSYVYSCTTGTVSLSSRGPDGINATADDLRPGPAPRDPDV